MMSGIAVTPAMPRFMPYGWVFVAVVIALILLIFIRVYVIGDRSQRRTVHRRSRARTWRKPRAANGIQATAEPAVTRKPAPAPACLAALL